MRAGMPIRDAFKSAVLGFKKFVGTQVELDPHRAMGAIKDALLHTGSVSFGETHGVYSHADFVTDFIPYAAEAGADRLYVEMFHQRNQKYIDEFQDSDDPRGLIWLMNNSPSFSDKMWVHFWNVLQAAKDYGLRIVTVQPDKLDSVFPGMEIFCRNIRFEQAVLKDQKAKATERPFIFMCGAWHLDRFMCSNGSPIHDMFGGAGVIIANGGRCLVRPGSKSRLAHMFVPHAPHQTPITPQPIRRKPQLV
jgi:hypothetical protein